MRLVQAGRKSGQDSEPISLVTVVAMLAEPGSRTPGAQEPGETVTVPWELLTPAFGAAESRELTGAARQDLADRVRLLLDEELLRFVEILDAADPVDPVAAVRLYQAEYALEAVR